MSDSETALAVAAAIAALRDDDEEMTQAVDENAGGDSAVPGITPEGSDAVASVLKQEEPQEVEPPKPKTKVMSCLICTKPVTSENTQLGSSIPSDEYERMMRVACKLLCVDSNPLLKRFQFRHSEEPKKLCCDECCEVVFNLGSLQSIIDRTKLAINKKLDWILKTVSDSAAEESDEIEKVFFGGRSELFRKEVLEVCKRRKNAGAKNGLYGDSDDEEEELINKGVQTDVSGESGVADLPTKAGRKFYDEFTTPSSFTFDDSNNMDTYSDHNNDDFNYTSTYDNDDTSYTSKPESSKRSYNKKSTTPSSASKQTNNRRGRPSTAGTGKRTASARFDESDDEIEILEEKKSNKPKSRAPPAKSAKLDARELVKVEYSGDTGRPKRSAAAKRPNYQMLAGDDDEDFTTPSYKRQSVSSNSGSDLSKNRKPPPRKDVTLSAIPIVKDSSGKTYFEGVEIVRTDRSITCKHLSCHYVVDGAGYNAFEKIKSHIHESHVGDQLPDIY